VDFVKVRARQVKEMNYESSIQRTLDYIEGNLDESLSLVQLAEIARFSPFHYHRVFQTLVGESVMDYVRKRRLTSAAERLFFSNDKVTDIAFDVGFQYIESFNRAFKKFYGVTPREYRAAKEITGPLIGKACLIKVQNIGGSKMEPKIITKPAFCIIGYELRTRIQDGQNHKDIPQFWQQYLQQGLGRKIPNPVHPYQELGICTNFNPETGEFSYVIGMEVPKGTAVPEGMVSLSLPEEEYVVFTTPKSDEQSFSPSIQSTWNYIFSEWFPQSGYEHAGTVEFELYDERCHGPENKEMDIYIPVRKQAILAD
jgi:AraC family transcriptional regulator